MANILVIDDDRAVLTTIELLLQRAGHSVEAVDNSRAGLQRLGDRDFDLLIVDIFMPGMDGFETMKRVHQSRPNLPVVIISGQEFRVASERRPDFLHMATRLGAVSSLQKPFKPVELVAAVANGLAEKLAPSGAEEAASGNISSLRQ